MPASDHPFAIVTGASSGIGYELAKCCARRGLFVAADEPQINSAADVFRKLGLTLEAMEVEAVAELLGNEAEPDSGKTWREEKSLNGEGLAE